MTAGENGRCRQPALPGIDMRPLCPLCGRPAEVLGQYSPFYPWGVCRACSLADPYPVEVLVPNTRRSKEKSGLMVDPNAPYEARERRAWLDDRLKQAVRGVDNRPVKKLNLNYLEIRNPIRRYDLAKYERYHAEYRRQRSARQISLPFCARCGRAHERSYEVLPGLMDYWSLCQTCEDRSRVEALWRNRGIFGRDDPEMVLDRLYAAFPELFARGTLPDYWFELTRETDA